MADVAEQAAPVADTEVKPTEVPSNGEKVETKENGTSEDTAKAEEKTGDNDQVKDDRKRSHHDREDRRDYNNKRNRGNGGGFRGGRGNKSNARNVKTRFDGRPESDDAGEIRRQVEFYFSDSNLPIDAYLLEQTGGHKNLPVPLKTIHNFKRMRSFQPFTAVRDAVKASKFLDLDDDDQITRKNPLSSKFTDNAHENKSLVHSESLLRSIYAKGFGDETEKTAFDIEEFFAPYGPTSSVRLRRHKDNTFKGSAFIEFETEDMQKQFLELDPKPQFEGKDLKIMSKQAYVEEKQEQILDGSVKPRSPDSRSHNFRGDRNNKHNRDRDNRNKERYQGGDWKAGRGDFQRRGGGRGGRGGGRSTDDLPKRGDIEAAEAAKAGAEGESTKTDAPAEESKKRSREEEGEAGAEAKKVKESEDA